jgi:hypothetical protein
MKKILSALFLSGSLLASGGSLYYDTTGAALSTTNGTAGHTYIGLYNTTGATYNFSNTTTATDSKYFLVCNSIANSYASTLKTDLFVCDGDLATELNVLHFVSMPSTGNTPGFVHDTSFKLFFNGAPYAPGNKLLSYAEASGIQKERTISTATYSRTLSIQSASISGPAKNLVVEYAYSTTSPNNITAQTGSLTIPYTEGVVKPLTQIVFPNQNPTSYKIQNYPITTSYTYNMGMMLKAAFSSENQSDYVIFGDCGFGYNASTNIYPTLGADNPGSPFTDANFSVLTSIDQGEVLNNLLPVLNGGVIPFSFNGLAGSKIKSFSNTDPDFASGSSSVANNPTTFPIPALYNFTAGGSGNDLPDACGAYPTGSTSCLPGFTPATIPHSSKSNAIFWGTTIPVKVTSLDKYGFYTQTASSTTYTSGATINFRFIVSPEATGESIKKSGVLSVTFA